MEITPDSGDTTAVESLGLTALDLPGETLLREHSLTLARTSARPHREVRCHEAWSRTARLIESVARS